MSGFEGKEGEEKQTFDWMPAGCEALAGASYLFLL